MGNAASVPLLEVSGISKSFPGVRALDGVSLCVRAGEVVGLVGENGAGKSTLIRVLAGAHQPDAGKISIDGHAVRFNKPVAAIEAGIGVIYQEFNLIPGLTAVENLFLGREAWKIDHRTERARALLILERLGVSIPLDAPCSQLSVAQQQIVEISRALVQDVRLLVMDEPTAALTPQEVGRLLEIVKELRSQGIGIIYVSHRLNEIFDVCDSVTVFRDGCHVVTRPVSEMSSDSLIEHMVGRAITNEYPSRDANFGLVRLSASGLTRYGSVNNVSLEVRAGELLGITGLVGSGRTELVRLLFGADRADVGEVCIEGKPVDLSSPRRAIQAGLCLLTEDRKREGLVLGRSVLENFSLASLPSFSSAGFVNGGRERTAFDRHVQSLRIQIASADQSAAGLSGGNQQKVLLARWLERQAGVIIFDEPTRGIDVGARHEIYQLMNSLLAEGRAIIMVTSELPEALGMSDRILVMHEGSVAGEVTDVAQATQEQVMDLAIGGPASVVSRN
jgi:ribose transport system ATP-binding protein